MGFLCVFGSGAGEKRNVNANKRRKTHKSHCSFVGVEFFLLCHVACYSVSRFAKRTRKKVFTKPWKTRLNGEAQPAHEAKSPDNDNDDSISSCNSFYCFRICFSLGSNRRSRRRDAFYRKMSINFCRRFFYLETIIAKTLVKLSHF